MKAITGAANTAFVGFFSSHIFATILIDSQAVLPPRWIPGPLRGFLGWYVDFMKDPLMGNAHNLLWFQCCVGLELVVQLPFFFWACQVLSSSKNVKQYPKRFAQASIAYAGHACTSMVPILATLATNPDATATQKAMILSVYLPYLIFPLALLYYATKDDDDDEGEQGKKQA